jgi:WD40 repeat protein
MSAGCQSGYCASQHSCLPPAPACCTCPATPAGDFEGEILVRHLPSGTCLAACSYGGAQFERAVRRLCWVPQGGVGLLSPPTPLLLACGEDGGLQFWHVPLPGDVSGTGACTPSGAAGSSSGEEATPGTPPAACHLVVRMAAVHRRQDCITSLCVADGGQRLWTGDSSGHVALWDISCINASSAAEPLPGTALRLAHWRAATAAVVSLETLAAPGSAGGQHNLLLVGSQDAAISLWKQQVGAMATHSLNA